MKKINVLIIAVIAVTTAFMTSCNPDTIDFAAPTITFENGTQTVVKNSDVVISGDILAPADIKQIVYFKDDVSYGNVVTSGFDSDTATHFIMTIPATDVTETFTFEVQVTDKNDKIGKSSVTVTVDDGVYKNNDIKIHCALKSHYQAEGGDFASAATGETFQYFEADGNADITAKIDFWYYYSPLKAVNRPVMVSPDLLVSVYHDGSDADDTGEVFPNANSTTFNILSDASAFSDWANVNSSILDELTGITNTTADGMDVDNVVAFETHDGRKGVFKVKEIYVTPNAPGSATDYIVVDIVVQKEAPVVK